MTTIIDLPFQDVIDQSSGATMEGFTTNIIKYGGKVSQSSFNGADEESSREEVWKVNWAAIIYATPAEVATGAVDQLAALRKFYKDVQTSFVRWKPFELPSAIIWKIVPNSLKVKQVAGCTFKASINLELQYTE